MDARSVAGQTRRLRILLAEDNEVNQRVAVRMLQKLGHDVIVAEDGQQAIDRLETESFDLVLMDVQMPNMDGFDATRHIRERAEALKAARVPIIALTAHAMKGDRERCLAAGMDGYVSKPIRVAEITSAIDRVLAQMPVNVPGNAA